ncbi:Lipase, class 3 [Cynara cardunculus var. scolymus]|uniref:Lipase, class 3 n=1 Tax=Cynara cardunculus var. scolymus TaxID=59895 RepID=A0A103XXX0_CYNCS|nr:Lipase, class 3 [Cynara cardunculus var. scolymus]
MAESMAQDLSDELIRAAQFQSMEAHKHSQQYKKHGMASSSSSRMEVLIFAFKGSWEVEDWYADDDFGETDVDHNLFPSLQRIGEGRLAKVNKAFLQRFQDLLTNSRFRMEVEKAVKEGNKILLTGHSSGGAIASFATLWILEEYARKQRIQVPIHCVTFGSPLIGDRNLSHAVRRNWAARFTHFVMEHDIVPRLMLAPKISVQEHLPNILKSFQQKVNTKVNSDDQKSHKFPKFFHPTPKKPVPRDQSVKADQAVTFFENVMIKASIVARRAAFDLMEPTSSLTEKLSVDYVKVSPYRPFGTYVFHNRDESQQLVVNNPNAVLQLLFYFLQLTNEHQNLADFALNSLAESLSYEEELKNRLQWQNSVDLKDLNGHLLTHDRTKSDAASNKALFELVKAKWCLVAAEEAENRKKENEKLIDASMRKYGPKQMRSEGTQIEKKIIEDILDEIREYKEKHSNGNTDYYEAFKLQDQHDDFIANINRLVMAKLLDVIIEMLMREDLPDGFEGRKEWVDLVTEFRRLVEPLDIANYYRHSKGNGYMEVRPKRYKFTQRWYEHLNVTGFESISESSFMAEVEELKKEVEEPRKKTLEEVKAGLESIEKQVQKWIFDEKIPEKDVFWGESTISKLWKELPYDHHNRS